MARRRVWRSALALLGAACAGEQVTAPGSCPAYCVGARIKSADTTLVSAVYGDSSFRGYVPAYSAWELQLAGPGGPVASRGVIHFARFSYRLPISSADTTTAPVAQVDSLRVDFFVRRQSKGVGNQRLTLYRIPRTVDSLTGYDDLTPYFNDSTRIIDVPVAPDSLGILKVLFSPTALPAFEADSFDVAIGLALQGDAPGFVSLGTAEIGRGAQFYRYAQIDSVPGTRVNRTESRRSVFDSYVWRPLPPPPAGALAVGGAPSSRAFVRLTIPKVIVDSGNVVRATLALVPAQSVIGASNDTLRVLAHQVSADFGPKSPLILSAADTSTYAGARVVSGVSDTVRVDITGIVRAWKGDTVHAHTLVLRAYPEGATPGELRFWSSAAAAGRPTLELTYIPRLNYQGR